jgi:hypothetical protein
LKNDFKVSVHLRSCLSLSCVTVTRHARHALDQISYYSLFLPRVGRVGVAAQPPVLPFERHGNVPPAAAFQG